MNENNLKDLLLHDDGNSAVIVQTLLVKGTYFTDEWLNYFTNETRKQQIRSFFEKKGLELIQEKILSQKNKIAFDMYGYTRGLVEGEDRQHLILNFLMFYLKHAINDQLETFVQDITAIRELRKISIFSKIISGKTIGYSQEKIEKIKEFMKLLSDKLGEDAVEQVVLHKADDGKFVFASECFWYEEEVTAMYAHLPKKKRDNIRHQLLTAVRDTVQIEKWIKEEEVGEIDQSTKGVEHCLGMDVRGVATNLPEGFNVLSLYFIEKFDKVQLWQVIELIVSVKTILTLEGNRRRYSIWVDYIDKVCAAQDDVIDGQRSCQAIQKLFEIVSQKFGKNIVKEKLLFHGGRRVIDRAASNGDFQILGVMLNYLDVSLQTNIFDVTFTRLEVVQGMRKKNYDTNKLTSFVDFILDVKEIDDKHSFPYSIWSDFIGGTCFRDIGKVLYFLDLVKKELGDEQLKRLMNHDVNGNYGRVILEILFKLSPEYSGEYWPYVKPWYLDKYPMLAEYLLSEEHHQIPATNM